MRDKYVLFTNLQFVTVGDVRAHCAALLLEEAPGMLGPPCRVRGFGMDAAWPVFDVFLNTPTVEYEIHAADSRDSAVVMGEGGIYPLMSGAVLTVSGGPVLELVVQDQDEPLQCKVFEGDHEQRVVLDVWEELNRQVVRFWDGPNMPTLHWVPTPGYAQRHLARYERSLLGAPQ